MVREFEMIIFEELFDVILDPLIEILSFGIDIRIRCNESYFQFDEINVSDVE